MTARSQRSCSARQGGGIDEARRTRILVGDRRRRRARWLSLVRGGGARCRSSPARRCPRSSRSPSSAYVTGCCWASGRSRCTAKALDDPLFKAKVDEADKATGGKFGPFCRRCHGPVANMTSQDGLPSRCHRRQRRGSCAPSATRSSAMSRPHRQRAAPPRAHRDDAGSAQGRAGAALHAVLAAPHNHRRSAAAATTSTTRSTACISRPPTTSGRRVRRRAKGIQCQDCHMSESPPTVGPSTGFAAEAAPERDNIYHMTFAGAQVALGNAAARHGAAPERGRRSRSQAPEVVSAGTSAEVTVMVTNVGAGHYLPTGVTDIRQMWLSVVAVDDERQRDRDRADACSAPSSRTRTASTRWRSRTLSVSPRTTA